MEVMYFLSRNNPMTHLNGSGLGILVPATKTTDPGAAPSFVNFSALGDKATGSRLRALRKLANLTQQRMALLSDDRLTQKDISRMEIYPEKTPLKHFIAASEVLGKTLHEVLEDVEVKVKV